MSIWCVCKRLQWFDLYMAYGGKLRTTKVPMAIVSWLIANDAVTFEYACSELHSKFPLRARFPEEYFNTLSSEYQHADILAKHFMCSRFTNVSQWIWEFDEFVLNLRWIGDAVCMSISLCFWARMNACVIAQLGSCFKSRRISGVRGAT